MFGRFGSKPDELEAGVPSRDNKTLLPLGWEETVRDDLPMPCSRSSPGRLVRDQKEVLLPRKIPREVEDSRGKKAR